MSMIALIADVYFTFRAQKLVSPPLQTLFSALFWILLSLGFYPFMSVNESTLHLQNKVSQSIETIRYTYFASPDTQLQHELDKGDTKNILIYLEKGANINIQSSQGATSLMIAIHNQDFALATELIKRGANINLISKQGRSALDILLDISYLQLPNHAESAPERVQLALLLLEKGAYLSDSLNKNCSRLLQGAVNTGSTTLVNQLFIVNQTGKNSPPMAENCSADPPLFLAAQRGDTAMVSLLIDKGAKVDIPEPLNLMTPLMASIVNKHPDTAMLLISKGANINAEDAWGDSVLFLALKYHTSIVMLEDKVVQALMKAKAQFNCRSVHGETIIIKDYDQQICSEIY